MDQIPAPILYEDSWFIGINKPIGMDSQDKPETWPQSIHRLDKPVSGVLLKAKTPQALARGMKIFSNRGIEKYYWVITAQELPLPQGELTHYLQHATQGNKTKAFNEPGEDRKIASLKYKLLSRSDRYFLYEIQLMTGRTHQIRAQLAAQGCPVKGDIKYGYPRTNPMGGIHLLAHKLIFAHPFTHKQVEIVADPPENDKIWTILLSSMETP